MASASMSSGRINCVPMPFEPMLASTNARRPLAGEWVLEPTFDGWRIIVAIDGEVRVWTRRGHDLTARLPELAPLADLIGTSVVLDGELVAGRPRQRLLRRAWLRGTAPSWGAAHLRRVRRLGSTAR